MLHETIPLTSTVVGASEQPFHKDWRTLYCITSRCRHAAHRELGYTRSTKVPTSALTVARIPATTAGVQVPRLNPFL